MSYAAGYEKTLFLTYISEMTQDRATVIVDCQYAIYQMVSFQTSCVDHKDWNDMWPTAASRGKNDIVWQIIRSTFGSRPNNIYAVVRFTTAYI